MRGSRTLVIGIGAAALGGLVAVVTASAAGFTLSQPTTNTQSFGTSTSSTSSTSSLPLDQINAALAALAGGAKMLGGPGSFAAGPNGESRIYEVLGLLTPSVCVTVRNLSGGEIRVSPSSSSSFDVLAHETRSVCVGPAVAIQLTCRQGSLCEAVWRVDRL